MEKTFEELIEEKRFEHSYMDGEDMVENHILKTPPASPGSD